MNVVVNLPRDQHVALERCAAASGIDVATLIQTIVQENLDELKPGEAIVMPYEKWEAEFRAFISRQRSRNPGVDDSRESIYD